MRGRLFVLALFAGLASALAFGCGSDRGSGGADRGGAHSDSAGRATTARTGALPNIILLDLDTFRGDRVGLYDAIRRGTDGARANTPHLDRLAKNGLYFPNAFSQAPRTLQSQMSIVTSRYPGSHDVGSERWALPDSATTLAGVLSDAGYETAAFVDLGWVRAKYGFDAGFDLFDESGGALGAIVPRALAWLDARESRKPFFVWLHAYDTHSPYDPRCLGEERVVTGMKFGKNPGFEGRLQPHEIQAILRERKKWRAFPDSTRQLMEASYDHAIGCADTWVGELLGGLDSLGVSENTIIACVSDHGEAFLEHGLFFHISLHHEILRVPFFIVAPGRGGTSIVDDRVVETIDLAPTLLDLAGLAPQPAFEGMSLTRGGALRPRDEWAAKVAFAETSPWDGKDLWWSMTTDSLHFLRSVKTGERELYAWRVDPQEKNELAKSDSVLADRMQAALLEWAARTSASDKPGHKPEPIEEPSAEEMEQMRALGYVQ
ncbi:MAG: sulfatase [bacterium]